MVSPTLTSVRCSEMPEMDIQQQTATAIREKALDALAALESGASKFDLPAPPVTLLDYHQKLRENAYTVLVVGEAKRGKSTFVNALIGRDILPTDVDIATAQVFRVTRAEGETYRLRFEDGSAQAVQPSELQKYGSQVVMDTEGAPRLDQIIRWIEIEVPSTFIPEGISILDTPGLGALYAAHAQITQRFVPHADAVIFVLDSTQPVGQPETEFVDQLLEITNSIFFVQTKIDLFRREDWQAIKERSEAILRERFADRLPDTRVWPISSTNLQKAGETGEEAYLMVSRHKELAAALQAFLFRVAGWARTADAVVLAHQYHALGLQALNGRVAALMEESKQKRDAQKQTMERRKAQFEDEWGANSQRRRELLAEIRRIATIGQQQVRQALQPGGAIENRFREQIEGVSDVESGKALGERMVSEVLSSVVDLWNRVCDQSASQAQDALEPFAVSAGDLAHSGHAAEGLSISSETAEVRGEGTWAKLAPTYQGLMVGGAIGQIGGSLGAAGLGLIGITVAPWLVAAVAVGGVLWGLANGWSRGSELERARVREQLTKNLTKTMQQVRSHLLDVDVASGRGGLVDEHFRAFEENVRQAVVSAANRASAQAEEELGRLAEIARMDDDQRKMRTAQVQEQLRDWSGTGKALGRIAAELQALEARFRAATQQ